MHYTILILHTAGLVGKSTITASVLYPRVGADPIVLSVETLCQDASRYGIPVERFRAAEFPAIMRRVQLAESSVIVDVGASNFVAFLQKLSNNPGSLDDFDIVLVITTPDARVQQETISTIETLADVGLDPSKIRILFNRADREASVPTQFEHVVAYAAAHPEYPLHKDAVVFENNVHADLAANSLSLQQVLDDPADYSSFVRAAVKGDRDSPETDRLIRMLGLQRAVRGVTRHLDDAFRALRISTGESR